MTDFWRNPFWLYYFASSVVCLGLVKFFSGSISRFYAWIDGLPWLVYSGLALVFVLVCFLLTLAFFVRILRKAGH